MEYNNEEINNNNSKVVSTLLICVVIAIVGYFIYNNIQHKEVNNIGNNNVTNNENIEENNNTVDNVLSMSPFINFNNLKKEDSSNNSYELEVYECEDDLYYYCPTNCDEENYFIIKTKSENAKFIDSYKTKYIFYWDEDRVKIYDRDSKDIYVTSIDYKFEVNMEFVKDTKTKEIIGFVYDVEDEDDEIKYENYYSISLDKVLYEHEYHDMWIVDDKYISASVFKTKGYDDFDRVDLISTKESKVLISERSNKKPDEVEEMVFDSDEVGKYKYYVLLEGIESGQHYKKIYTEDLKEIIYFKNNVYYDDISFDENGKIHAIEGNVVNVYDNTGKKIDTSESYDKLLYVHNDLIVAVVDNYFILTTIGGEEIKICKYVEDYKIYSYNEEGIHISVKDKSVKVDDIWDYYKDKDIYESKAEIKEELDEWGCYTGYDYYYDLYTKEVTKHHDIICYG